MHVEYIYMSLSYPWSLRMAPMTPSTRGQPGPRLSPWLCKICSTHSSCFCLISKCRMLESSFRGFSNRSCSLCERYICNQDQEIHKLYTFIQIRSDLWERKTFVNRVALNYTNTHWELFRLEKYYRVICNSKYKINAS